MTKFNDTKPQLIEAWAIDCIKAKLKKEGK